MNKKILFVASEALPFAASGGLGDVIGSLPAAIKKADREVDIRVVIPLYKSISQEYREGMHKLFDFYVPLCWRTQYCGVYEYICEDMVYYFLDNEYYFNRDSLYGSFDDAERYAFFSRAVLEMLPILDWYPDVLHAHDWQSALSVIYLKRKYGLMEHYKDIRTVFTIHNIAFQGMYGFNILSDVFDLSQTDRDIVDFDGIINLMKGAIVCCDLLTTVSPTYASEICTDEYSFGLAPIINANRYKLCGILNGIDTAYYSPLKDTELAANYSAATINKKQKNKTALQQWLCLPERDVPLVAIISRLTSQKGLDLVKYVSDNMLMNDIQFVVLGQGDFAYEEYFRNLEYRHRDKVRSLIMFDKAVSKKLYAAADILLMPSKNEPCGLSQMIASRYGAVPLVRETGGLGDSIKSYYPLEDGTFFGNGFTFRNYNGHDMLFVLNSAIELYHDRQRWTSLATRAMKTDFSWKVSAKEYIKLYERF